MWPERPVGEAGSTIVSVDRDGWFSVVDRVKELIKYNGYQVPPAELEAVLVAHPCVADVAVIAGEDDDGAEVPKAFSVHDDLDTLLSRIDEIRGNDLYTLALRELQTADVHPSRPARASTSGVGSPSA